MGCDGSVTEFWGKKAAARVFHICRTGCDVEIEAFARGAASEKPVRLRLLVAGSPSQARTKVRRVASVVVRRDAQERR